MTLPVAEIFDGEVPYEVPYAEEVCKEKRFLSKIVAKIKNIINFTSDEWSIGHITGSKVLYKITNKGKIKFYQKEKLKSSKKKVVKKKVGLCVKNGRLVKVYKITGKQENDGKKVPKGKKAKQLPSKNKAASAKKSPKKHKSRRRRSSFGVSGNYMPLGSIMSPYPSSVSSGAPWI